MIHMAVLLTSRNCTSPNSPSSDTHAYAASLCRKSWHNVISSLLNNDPIFHGLYNTPLNKNNYFLKKKAPSQSASRLWQRRNRITSDDKSIDMNNFQAKLRISHRQCATRTSVRVTVLQLILPTRSGYKRKHFLSILLTCMCRGF